MADVFGNAAMTTLVTSAISTPHVNPPPQNIADKNVPTSPVALYYQIEWGDGEPHDIDLHVVCKSTTPQGQSISVIVNYLQPYKKWLRLSKDDQGLPTPKNVEKVEATSDVQGIPPNTVCRANVHMFNSHGGKYPVAGKLTAIHMKDDQYLQKRIGEVYFTLTEPGQEISLIVSAWDAGGNLIEDSIRKYPDVETKLVATAPSGTQIEP